MLGALGVLILPAVAEACATCVASPFGDRTYNWPYIFLILLPFAVVAVIGGVLAHVSGVSLSTLRESLARRFHPAAREEETT
jgi:MFS family permease